MSKGVSNQPFRPLASAPACPTVLKDPGTAQWPFGNGRNFECQLGLILVSVHDG